MESKRASIIVLSGGASSRFGSDKSKALIGAQSLIQRILTSIPAEFEVIIVGPEPGIETGGYFCLQEKPLGGGPVAGFKAGLAACTSEIVGLIATDMPFAITGVINLLNSMTPHDDAVIYVDAEGFKQPLAAVYRVAAVEKALVEIGDANGQSMRNLVSHLQVREIEMDSQVAQTLIDIDTQADLKRAIAFSQSLADNSEL